jgi:hypothetical protein
VIRKESNVKQKKVQQLEHGLYKIWWKSGGASLAAVGSKMNGERWMACTSWISDGTASWPMVKKVKRIK